VIHMDMWTELCLNLFSFPFLLNLNETEGEE
jgi:hypothetical protein